MSDPRRISAMSTTRDGQDRAATARAVHLRRSAERALDDPVALARAARIVRLALERQRLQLADLTAETEDPVLRRH
jgi:hypothetical protein